ncbi:MAG TPA: PA2779 family protein [Thiobacillaceae bacterium]|nr:PA2779 family protein [Thiobacillaceae bacterium]
MTRDRFKQFIAWLLIASTCNLAQFAPANAAMVATDQLAGAAQVQDARDKLKDFLARADVRRQFEQLGVDPSAAQARADALTDEEIQRVSGQINQLPAGGDVLGVIVFIFVLLLITDILGLTKIFPFTRPIR